MHGRKGALNLQVFVLSVMPVTRGVWRRASGEKALLGLCGAVWTPAQVCSSSGGFVLLLLRDIIDFFFFSLNCLEIGCEGQRRRQLD